MSASSLLNKDILRLASIKAIIGNNIENWRGQSTLERRGMKEAEILNLFHDIDNGIINYSDVTISNSPDIQYFKSVYDYITNLNLSNREKYQTLTKLFLDKHNNSQMLINDLLSQVKRIKQKQAVLDIGNSKFNKFVTGSKIYSLDKLGFEYCGGTEAAVDTVIGAAHLPVTVNQIIAADSVLISSTSNGQAGSSDLEVNFTDQRISSILDSANEIPFVYEKLHSGPCVLTLSFKFNRPVIVNSFLINLGNIEDVSVPEITSVDFTTANNYHLTFKDLTDQPIKTNTKADDQIGALFPPVEVVGVTFTIKQAAHQILTRENKVTTVKQFPISIKSVQFFQNQYSNTGLINSKAVVLPRNAFAMQPVIDYYPTTKEYFDLFVDVSFDGGASWKTVGTEDSVDITLVSNRNFLWRLKLQRNDAAFNSYGSFVPVASNKLTRKNIQRTISTGISPYSISLSSKPRSESDIYVWQPKILSRGKATEATRLGSTVAIASRMPMPIDLQASEANELIITIGGYELTFVSPGVTPTTSQWTLTDDGSELIFPAGLTASVPIYARLEPENLYLEDTIEGYLGIPRYPFDSDKDTITLKSVEPNSIKKSIVLSRTSTIIRLGVKNLIADTFEIVSEAGDTWTSISDRNNLGLAPNTYYLDAVNGTLYLSGLIGEDNVSVSFRHYPEKLIDPSDVDISFNSISGAPEGILIGKKSLHVQDITETISDSVINTINANSGTYGQRDILISTHAKKKQLGYKNIIGNTLEFKSNLLVNGLQPEEVKYIDGKSEFLGLTKIETELTNELEANGSGNVSFSLSARSLWYRPFGVGFSSSYFSTQVAIGSTLSLGEYYIQKDGTVVVNVGAGNTLPADIVYSYYYRSEDIDPENKISIDYVNGILCSFSQLNPSAIVKYSVCPVLCSYDIVKPIAFNYDKSSNKLEFNTTNFHKINNKVKVLWVESPYDLSPSKIKENFTPVVSKVGFRFS